MRNRDIFILTAVFLGNCILTGCSDNTQQGDASEVSSKEGNPPQSPVQETRNSQAKISAVDPHRKETQWIGSIPYDVFYDDPLTVASDTRRIGGNRPATLSIDGSETSESTDTGNSTSPVSGSGGVTSGKNEIVWSEVLPMPMLIDEVKSIRTRLAQNIQTLGTFNKATEEISLDGAMLSALGAIGTVHQDESEWKERAKFVRDLGYEIYLSSSGTGRTAFTATEDPYMKLITALDGGTISDMEAEEVVAFSDLIYVSEIMKRIDASLISLKANINTESRMTEDPEKVERELRVLAALVSMMGSDGYDSAEQELYQKLVSKFLTGAMQGVKAVKAEDFESFRAGLNQIQSTCAECHQQYRSNSSSF